jgi:hypothetical protein
MLARLVYRGVRREGSAAQEAMPAALVAPARAKPWRERIPTARFYSERDRIAVRAAVTVRQNEEKDDRRRDEAQDEEANEDDGEDDCIRHRGHLLL